MTVTRALLQERCSCPLTVGGAVPPCVRLSSMLQGVDTKYHTNSVTPPLWQHPTFPQCLQRTVQELLLLKTTPGKMKRTERKGFWVDCCSGIQICMFLRRSSLQSFDWHWPSPSPWTLNYHCKLTIIMYAFGGESTEKAMAPHSSTLAWKMPWTEEPGGLQSMGSRRVGHAWAISLSFFTFMHWRRKWQPTPVFLPGESQGWGSLVGCRLWGCTELDTTEAT